MNYLKPQHWKQEDQEYKASFHYTMNSRLAWAIIGRTEVQHHSKKTHKLQTSHT